ncbi:GNAT family N-acetyltransferase [Paenibacillus sp. FSL R7-0337]|uniref:GNAT family N-acetyltransferase n=1 Tax=Paenibacillus sp. FSL R7-0337 TaxID=1926588 RepID=UPI00096F1622|nr:GNAT family N-acetyltransferase [Paenibacillus sp. FSL R7-0337]OMG00477.1 GNAT family N-acetyltransferase [Paenibacillus sp. FSL R7-0337]
MSTLQVEIVDRLDEEQKREVARLYYQAFTLKFSGIWIFSRKEQDIVDVLSRCLHYDKALYAVYEGRVVGFAGLETGVGFFMTLNYRSLRQTFGLLGGAWRYAAYGIFRLLHGNTPSNAVHIDPLVVSEQARGLGVGTRLLEAVFAWSREADRSKVLLEVVDTNPLAKKLYERVGFRTFKVQNTRLFSSQAGFHKVLHMEKMLN